MAQLPIYLDDRIARQVKRASRQSGLSRSKWVSRVIEKELEGTIPERFFEVLGTWQDDRTPEKILKDIRLASSQKRRESLR